MAFDINVAFNVQTQELVNARNALQSLTQAARELNTNQEKAANSSGKLVKNTEELAEVSEKTSKAVGKTAQALEQVSKSAPDLTKSQETMMAFARAAGISDDMMKQLGVSVQQTTRAKRDSSAADKTVVNALAYLDKETRKVIETTDAMSRGFTSASANALFRHKEALQATGVSALELKQRLYTLEQDLMKRQGTSPFAKMREDIKQVTQQTNHLARAISVQLGDVAISLAGGQNPFVVLLQQGDQIRGAVQQAVDAGQSIDKAMKGAVLSMVNSFKLVGTVVKEFAMDGLRSVGDALNVVSNQMARNNSINKQFADGTITATRHARLLEQASLQNAKALGTLRIVVGGVAAAIGVALAKAYFDVSQENFELTKSLALTGASLGLSSERAISLAKSMTAVGVSATNGKTILTEMAKAGGFTAQQFTEISDSVVSFSEATGSSLKDVVKMFSEVNKDPVKALSDLQIAQGNVSQEIIKNVKELADQKNMVGASELAMREFARATKEVAEEIKVGMPWYKELGGWLDKAAQSAWDFAKGLWDSGSAAQQLEKIQKQLKEFKETGSTPWWVIGPIMKEDWANGIVKQQKEVQAKIEAQDKQAADRRAASQQEAGTRAAQSMMDGFKKTISSAEKKTIGRQEFIKKGIEEYKNALGKAEASVQDLADAEKALGIEWDNSQKKSKRASETYKAVRDNTIVETKKFYDTQLKALQDYESKQSQVNKSAYDSRAISLGEYLAKELQLVASSQNQQLSILKTSEAAYLSNVEARKQVLTASAKEAIAKGGNASKIMEKLAQDIENLENSTKSSTEAFKTQREALENATNAKYAKFYEEVAKTINSSKDALEKFNETISDNARKRREALEEQQALLDLHGAEAAAYKASRSAMSGYSSEIRESKKALEEATKALSDFNETTAFDDTSSFEQYKILVENKTQAEKRFIETTSQAQKDSNQAAADAMLEYNLGVFKEIRASLSESVYDALFEGGKNGGQSIKDTLKKMFKNYVINVFLNPIMGQVAGAFGFGGGAQGAVAGVGNALGMVSNLSSIYSAFSGGLVSSISGAIGTLGSTFGSSALTSFSAGMKGASLASGLAGPTTAGASGAMGAGASFANALPVIGWIMAGMGASANAYSQGYTEKDLNWANPIGLVEKSATRILKAVGVSDRLAHILTGASLTAKIFDKLGLGKATLHAGAGAIYQNGVVTEGSNIYNRATFGMGSPGEWQQVTQTAVSGIATSIGESLDEVAKTFGLKAGYSIYTAFADDSSKDGAWGSLKITDAIGKVLVDWENTRSSKWAPKVFANGEEGYKQYLEAIQSDTLKAIQAMDLPKWAKQIFEVAQGSEGLKAALTQTALIVAQFESLGKTLKMFSGITGEMQTALLEAFGGIEGVTTAASTFYEGFYSEEERLKIAGDNMNATLKSLGLSIDVFSGDAAKADFRKAVEEAFSANNTGLASALLAISGSFAEVADAAKAAAPEVEKVAVSFWEAYAKLGEKAGYTGSVRAYNADVVAGEIKQIFASLGVEKDISVITQAVLGATKKDVEEFFKQLWPLMQTGEAKSNLIDISDALLDIVESGKDAEQALQEFANSIVSELTAAFNSMNSAANILQKIETALTGSSSGLVREQQLWESISTSDYRKQIELAGELSDIILSRYQTEQQNAQKLLDFGKSLQAYVNGLKIGNLSTLTPAEKLAEAGKQYADTLKKAQAGDEAAKSALQGASSAYLELARQYFASSDDYTKIFESVTGAVDALGIKSQSEAQMQLEVSSNSLNELKKLEAIVKQAYQTATTDFSVQKNLLQQQIDQMLRTADGVEKVQSLLAGLPYGISSQFNTGGTSGKPGGAPSSSFNAMAQQYIDIMGSKTPSTDVGYVSSYMASADAAKWSEEYYNAMALLQKQEDRDRLSDLFNRLAIIKGIKVNGSHKNGLDNVPFDGYVARLHQGERVLTAEENKAYTPSMSVNGNTGMSVMAAEIRSLNSRIDKLTAQNERLMLAQIRATVESNNSSSERVVEGITKATEKAAYANTIEKGYK